MTRSESSGLDAASARYPIPAGPHEATLEIDRSRFRCTLALARSVDDAQAFIRTVQRAAPDATHHCWAYLVGPPGSTDRIGLSDDGEPHGTAGRPMLTVLQHAGIGDIAAVVTRWYGGIKLGTGGLVKAYSGAVQAALDTLPRAWHVATTIVTARVAYGALGAVRLTLPTFEVDVLAEDFASDITLQLRCPVSRADALRQALRDCTRGQVVFLEADEPTA